MSIHPPLVVIPATYPSVAPCWSLPSFLPNPTRQLIAHCWICGVLFSDTNAPANGGLLDFVCIFLPQRAHSFVALVCEQIMVEPSRHPFVAVGVEAIDCDLPDQGRFLTKRAFQIFRRRLPSKGRWKAWKSRSWVSLVRLWSSRHFRNCSYEREWKLLCTYPPSNGRFF